MKIEERSRNLLSSTSDDQEPQLQGPGLMEQSGTGSSPGAASKGGSSVLVSAAVWLVQAVWGSLISIRGGLFILVLHHCWDHNKKSGGL